MTPHLSIIILTLDEERDIGACLASLADQRNRAFEVLVLDAASTDRTIEIVREAQDDFPVPLRLVAWDRRVPIGEARNRGVERAVAPHVAFLSADVEADPDWVDRALSTLEHHDVAYGRQVHAPHRWTSAAAVRGLRYHFPEEAADEPLRYASHAAAAYRREVPEAFPFNPGEDAVDDLLLARRAAAAGYQATYDPCMVVHHHDVTGFHEELSKNRREARGWGTHADELGLHGPVLAWGSAVLLSLVLVPWWPLPALALLAGLLWAPALRRAARRWGSMEPLQLIKGVAASPLHDLAFLSHYLRGLGARASDRLRGSRSNEVQA